MAGEEQEQGRSFKVQDRRRFSATGEARDEAGEQVQADAPPATPEAPESSGATADDVDGMAGEPAEINFATFVISLSAQALAHLGEMPDPVDQQTRVNLDGARQIIDILGILSEKTRGNLDAAESSLLSSALFDLRMKYVDRAHGR
jgi:Domain of unknown function (DUF1844)